MTETHKRKGIKKKCVWCGKVFVDYTKNHNRKYCSRQCFNEAKKEQYWEKKKKINKIYWRVCQWCGHRFISDYNPNTQYYLWEREKCPKCGRIAMGKKKNWEAGTETLGR